MKEKGELQREGSASTLAHPRGPSRGASGPLRRMDVEAAIMWAVRDELPKLPAGGAARAVRSDLARLGYGEGGIAAFSALGTAVDGGAVNAFGLVPFGQDGAPHPDALTIWRALELLDSCALGDLAEWDAFPDLAALEADAAGALLLARARADARALAGAQAAMRAHPSRLMVRAAVLGPPAGWSVGAVEVETVRGPYGKPRWFRRAPVACAWNDKGEAVAWHEMEVDGYDARAKRPYPDAYQRKELKPCPLPAALARAEWQIWRAGLDVVLEACREWGLASIELEPSARPWEPWADAREGGRRVLSGGPALPKETARERPRAGRSILSWERPDRGAQPVVLHSDGSA